ncbi:MAG: hypothetical protein RSG95_00395 [Bacilli bacterium]
MKAVEEFEKLVRRFRENKLSHAYLIETNNIDNCFVDLTILIKKIDCPENYSANCVKCNLCNLIEQRLLPSLIVVEPDGKNIKKEQILDLKRSLIMLPTFTKNNIYIIKNAEKLNDSSANTMLKFLEEPNDFVIGFFITNNVNNVIDTIKSRCEILNINYTLEENVEKEEYLKYNECVKNYIIKTEVEKTEKIMYNRLIILNEYTEKFDIENIFKLITSIYEHTLNKKLGINAGKEVYKDFEFLEKISIKGLIKRINLLTEFLNNIKTNANVELLMDKYIIELSDLYE